MAGASLSIHMIREVSWDQDERGPFSIIPRWFPVDTLTHKVHIYLEYHSVCPLVETGTPVLPFLQASVLPTEYIYW